MNKDLKSSNFIAKLNVGNAHEILNKFSWFRQYCIKLYGPQTAYTIDVREYRIKLCGPQTKYTIDESEYDIRLCGPQTRYTIDVRE